MKKPIRFLALGGLFVALDIVFTRFLGFYVSPDQLVRASPQFLAHALAGWTLGPVWGVGTAVAGDILGMLINSAGKAFLPGYTLSAAASGLLYGLLLHNRAVRWWRALLAVGAVTLLVSLGLGSFWGYLYFGNGFTGALILQLPWRAILMPAYAAVLFFTQKALLRAKILDSAPQGMV